MHGDLEQEHPSVRSRHRALTLPVERCLHELRHISTLSCSSVAERVSDSLDTLEKSCGNVSFRTRSLRQVRERLRPAAAQQKPIPFLRLVEHLTQIRPRRLGF